MVRTPFTVATALAVTLLIGGCSSDPVASDGASTANDATTTTAETPAGGPDTPARPSSGCDAPNAAFATTTDGTIQSGGVERQYKLFAPPAVDAAAPLPLVLTIHGYGSGKDLFARISEMGALAQQEGFVAVFPHGSGQPPSWSLSADGADPESVTYLNDLLDTVENELCIDTAREYVTGFSQGAALTTLLSCTQPERFAAAAPVGGISDIVPCEPTAEMPVMVFHGTDDHLTLLDGGFGGAEPQDQDAPAQLLDGPPRAELVAAWAERNGCSDEPAETNPAEGARLVSYDCPAGAEVEFYILEGAGHTWPGSEFHVTMEAVVGPTLMSIDATETMWAFFEAHARP